MDGAAPTDSPVKPWRRWVTLITVCWMTIPMTFSVASVLAAAPEVAADFGVATSSVSLANAGVFAAMAVSPLIWFPIVTVIGRRPAYLCASCLLGACSIVEALAPTYPVFVSIWVLGGTTGVTFLILGQTIISDIFEATIRGRAIGLFTACNVSSQMIAPLTGGIIATYASWRGIYGVQAGLTAVGGMLAFFFVPNDVPSPSPRDAERPKRSIQGIVKTFSVVSVFSTLRYPSILFCNVASTLLAFNLYGLMSSIRYCLSAKLGIESSMASGLFYIAPGMGLTLGSVFGGFASDWTVKRYIVKRDGIRLPRDRMRSGLIFGLLLLPAATLLFGWALERGVGGVYVPAVAAFLSAIGIMCSFNPLHTFSAEVLPAKKRNVISCKYVFQYGGSAIALASRPATLVNVGIGWAFTITAMSGFLSAMSALAIVYYKPKAENLAARDELELERLE